MPYPFEQRRRLSGADPLPQALASFEAIGYRTYLTPVWEETASDGRQLLGWRLRFQRYLRTGKPSDSKWEILAPTLRVAGLRASRWMELRNHPDRALEDEDPPARRWA